MRLDSKNRRNNQMAIYGKNIMELSLNARL